MNAYEGLLPRLLARDQEAQSEFRSRVFPRILATCRSILRNGMERDVAEDILMDFLFDHVDKVRKESALNHYLRMMTVRRCIRIKGMQYRHEEIGQQECLCHGSESETLDRLETNAEVSRLARCMEHLNLRTQLVLRLRYAYELTQEKIGTSLGVSKQYAGRVVNAALKQLRKCMEEAP